MGRFAIVAVLFIIAVFGFFIGWGIGAFVLSEFGAALTPLAPTEADEIITLLQFAFGIICSIALTMIVFIFVIESLSSEPETYYTSYRRGPYQY